MKCAVAPKSYVVCCTFAFLLLGLGADTKDPREWPRDETVNKLKNPCVCRNVGVIWWRAELSGGNLTRHNRLVTRAKADSAAYLSKGE